MPFKFQKMKKLVSLLFTLLLVSVFAKAQVFTDSNLPIVVIETDGGVTIPDEPKVLATMKIIWHQDGSRNYLTDIDNPAFLNYSGRIGIERRGSTSQSIAKKPYGLTTLQDDDVTNNNVSLLGMPEENDWILNNLAYDQTGMRDVIAYELSESLGHYASRRVYCEVIINGDYKGLYVFMEKIKVDKNRVNVEKMDQTCNNYPEVTGGYITKADKTTGGDPIAWYMGSGFWNNVAYIHHYPKPSDVTQAQNNYIKSVFFDLQDKAQAHNESLQNGIPSIIDIPSFIDFMMVAEFSSNVDAYQLSTFFHKDRKGKLRAGPVWDYNLSFGHDEFGNRSRYDVWQFNDGNNEGSSFWKNLFNTPTYRCYMAKRWFELTQPGQPFNYETLTSRMDEIDAWISEGVSRDRQRWNNMTYHEYYVGEMKEWLQLRIDWMNNHIGDYQGCAEVELPPLVISKIHYHPEDWWGIDGDRLEFIEITNNGDATVDLSGVYFRELGVSYSFPFGATLDPHEALWLCSDSLSFVEYYNAVPFGQYTRKLSNKSENLVLTDAWGNVIDEVCYQDDDPWPWLADGEGPYLELIDLDLDNSLPESWTLGYDLTSVSENEVLEGFHVYPNPAHDKITITFNSLIPKNAFQDSRFEIRICNTLGQTLILSTSSTVDISDLPSGLYFITLGGTTQKLLVNH